MKIAVFGLGYVGFTAACCMAKEGHTIHGIDINQAKVDDIAAGIPPFAEPGTKELLSGAIQENRFTTSTSIGDCPKDIDLAVVCVGTPSAADGSHDMSYIAEVSRRIAEFAPECQKRLTITYRSTFRPGTMNGLVVPIFKARIGGERLHDAVELIYNPEFLRESQAVDDYFSPPKVVIGTSDGSPSGTMDALHANIDAPVFYTRYGEAEFTKFVDNSWHAVKVTFANEIGRVCTHLDVSASKIHEIFVSDSKLNMSPLYTRPGGAFGGSCLPKDVRALQHIATDVGANALLVDSLIRSNEAHKNHQLAFVTRGLAEGDKVLMAGLAFKSNTDDLRESPNVDLARKLIESGYALSIYDPALDPKKLKGRNLGYAYSNLPSIDALLVDKATAESGSWSRIIATNSTVDSLCVSPELIIRTDIIN